MGYGGDVVELQQHDSPPQHTTTQRPSAPNQMDSLRVSVELVRAAVVDSKAATFELKQVSMAGLHSASPHSTIFPTGWLVRKVPLSPFQTCAGGCDPDAAVGAQQCRQGVLQLL